MQLSNSSKQLMNQGGYEAECLSSLCPSAGSSFPSEREPAYKLKEQLSKNKVTGESIH